MPKNDTAKPTATVQDLCDRLDAIIYLLLSPAIKNPDPPKGLGLQILSLCDYEHTTDDICRAVSKTPKHVAKELSLLRTKGMIRTVKRDKRQVHIRVR
jgi:hypothetical protein